MNERLKRFNQEFQYNFAMSRAPAKTVFLIIGILSIALLSGGCGSGSENDATGGPANSSAASDTQSAPSTLSNADCNQLGEFVAEELEQEVEKVIPFLTPPVFTCETWTGIGIFSVAVDKTRPVRPGFLAQITAGNAHPVAGLGEPTKGKAGAYWAPALNHLYVYTENGWFDIYVPVKVPDAEAREDDIRLARLALEITAE